MCQLMFLCGQPHPSKLSIRKPTGGRYRRWSWRWVDVTVMMSDMSRSKAGRNCMVRTVRRTVGSWAGVTGLRGG
jgi:hypothetical protein